MSTKAKFKNQQKMLDTIDKLFFKYIKKRDLLIAESSELHKDKIIQYDLKLSMYIKKRARITDGGYNFILEEMWDWHPFFSLNKRLLPKITRNLQDNNGKH